MVLVGYVVCNIGKYVCFENIKNEVNSRDLVQCVYECSVERGYVEEQCSIWEELVRIDLFVVEVGRDFEDDVGDVEYGNNNIVVIVFQVKVVFKIGKVCIFQKVGLDIVV